MKQENKKNNLTEKIAGIYEDIVAEIFDDRKEIYAMHIRSRVAAGGIEISEGVSDLDGQAEWLEIDSLSRLRGVVGGRFENLKNKWLAAGFPLKESKNSKYEPFKVDQNGWLELSTWISNQGFEARLNPDKKEILFEIKST